MAQFARPDADVAINSWTEDDGATDALWDEINESTPSDTDYVKVVAADSTLEIGLGTLTDPVSSVNHVVRFRMYGTGAGGPEKLTVHLRMGASTTIASLSNQQSDGVWGDKSFTLSAAQANAITDYTDLRLQFISTGNTGGSDEIRCSFAEFEVPDVSSGGDELGAGLNRIGQLFVPQFYGGGKVNR